MCLYTRGFSQRAVANVQHTCVIDRRRGDFCRGVANINASDIAHAYPLLIVAFEFLTLDVQPGRFPNKGGTESCLVAMLEIISDRQ